jgi:MYXO-CTERM domain-containing protein
VSNALALALAAVVAVAAETPTTEMRRVVGEPLPSWVVVGAGVALFVLILVAGLVARRRR